jgi:hypothetical protein
LAVLRERGLQLLDGAAGFDADGKVGPGMLDDLVEASGRKNDVGASRRVAPRELGAATTRKHGKASVVCETKNSGKLLFVGRFEDKTRLNAANGLSRSGCADRIWGQDRAEFVFDVERS